MCRLAAERGAEARRGGANAGGGRRRRGRAARHRGRWARSSSADPCTASRCRTTGSSTWPIGRTAACRCSRRTASTSRRCSSIAPGRRRVGRRARVLARRAAAVPLRRRLRQLAHRRARSEEPATPLSVRAAQREAGRLPGPHHLAVDSKGNSTLAKSRRAHARSASCSRDSRTRCRPMRIDAGHSPASQRAARAPAPRRRLRARRRARFRHRVRRAAAIRRGPARWPARTA